MRANIFSQVKLKPDRYFPSIYIRKLNEVKVIRNIELKANVSLQAALVCLWTTCKSQNAVNTFYNHSLQNIFNNSLNTFPLVVTYVEQSFHVQRWLKQHKVLLFCLRAEHDMGSGLSADAAVKVLDGLLHNVFTLLGRLPTTNMFPKYSNTMQWFAGYIVVQ